MGALVCQNCKNGIYIYTEPDREDWENREMTCDNCGNKDTIANFTKRFREEVSKTCEHEFITKFGVSECQLCGKEEF